MPVVGRQLTAATAEAVGEVEGVGVDEAPHICVGEAEGVGADEAPHICGAVAAVGVQCRRLWVVWAAPTGAHRRGTRAGISS